MPGMMIHKTDTFLAHERTLKLTAEVVVLHIQILER